MRFDIARGKAWGAPRMGMSNRLIRDRLATRSSFQVVFATVADGQFVPVPGGVLVLRTDRTVIRALGVIGDTSEKDEYSPLLAFKEQNLTVNQKLPTKIGKAYRYLASLIKLTKSPS